MKTFIAVLAFLVSWKSVEYRPAWCNSPVCAVNHPPEKVSEVYKQMRFETAQEMVEYFAVGGSDTAGFTMAPSMQDVQVKEVP